MLYPLIKNIHVASVYLSLTLFVFRGGLMFADSRWLQHPAIKVIPHVVDTVLLASALWLMVLVQQYPFVHHWLTVKVSLLVLYIVLGSIALKRGRTKTERGVFFILAVATILFMVSVARAHHPLGIFYTSSG